MSLEDQLHDAEREAANAKAAEARVEELRLQIDTAKRQEEEAKQTLEGTSSSDSKGYSWI